MVMGDSGIIAKAQNAKAETNRSNAKEEISLIIIEVQADKAEKGEKATLEDIKNALADKPDEYVVEVLSEETASVTLVDNGKDIAKAKEIKITNKTKYNGIEIKVTNKFEISATGEVASSGSSGSGTESGGGTGKTGTGETEGGNNETPASNGETVTITQSGASVKITIPLSQDIKDYYGKEVEYLNEDGTSVGGKTWRLFYVDFEGDFGDAGRIYIKADWKANDFTPDTALSSYTLGTTKEYYKVYADINPDWAANRLTEDSSISNWNTSEKAAAYMCDTTKWTRYVSNKTEYSSFDIFAIGGPSAEMFCKSYNVATGKTGSSQYKAAYASSTPGGYKYSVDNGNSYVTFTASNSILPSVANGMYLDEKVSSGMNHSYWLASPPANSNSNLCQVSSAGAYITNGGTSWTLGSCPLVSLPAGFSLQLK